ncbi:MAG: hypothetical protein K6L75_14000 [Cellvibrionaceae bacterium]
MRKYLIVCCFILVSSIAVAEELSPFSVERSQVVTYESELLSRSYKLYIQLPRSFEESPKRYYPFVFLNDGNYSFPMATSISSQLVGSRKVEDLLIVGISYSQEVSWQISRTRDYTPTYAPKENNYHSAEAREYSGGAKSYLEFIEKELFPYLNTYYRADLKRKIYAGHSFGGLFGGFILKAAPSMFDYYIISDPSFWYDNEAIFNVEQNRSEGSKGEIGVLITASNPHPDRKVSSPLRMKENAYKFGEELRNDKKLDLNVTNLVFDGEIHESLFPISYSRGLRDYLGTK